MCTASLICAAVPGCGFTMVAFYHNQTGRHTEVACALCYRSSAVCKSVVEPLEYLAVPEPPYATTQQEGSSTQWWRMGAQA
jgi:hypothetical protein